MAMDDRPFDELVTNLRTAANRMTAPPDLYDKSIERIRNLPPIRTFGVVRRLPWSSASLPLVYAVVVALIAVPMIVMYAKISHNEMRISASQIQINTMKITKEPNSDIIKSKVGKSENNEIIFCKPQKASMDVSNGLKLIVPNREYDIIHIRDYQRSSCPDVIIHLPEIILNHLGLNEDNLEEQEIHVYEDRRESKDGADRTEM